MILSVSRRTDIPAFYADWFIKRLRAGFLYVRNPFNANQISKINLSPDTVECLVFWSKNPQQLVRKLHKINDLGYKYYFQFTVTSYDKSIEEHVPKKELVINTFKDLSNDIGPDKVIWRYDPILLSEKFNFEYHVKWFEFLSKQLHKYTNKCVISFIDMYKKSERNLHDVHVQNIDVLMKKALSKSLAEIAACNNLSVESCAEDVDLAENRIIHGKCIDDNLISAIISRTLIVDKDKTQRNECGCVTSVDIGSYNTCSHGCKYCYANFSKKSVANNLLAHDVNSPLLTGTLSGNEKITERKMTSCFKKQQLLF